MSAPPLAALVHVPKTAGTTLNLALLRHHGAAHPLWPLARHLPEAMLENSVTNRWLARGMARGVPHLELYLKDEPKALRLISGADWVSGHIARHRFGRLIKAAGRQPRWVGLMREPTAQVTSHYRWWIEIFARGPWRYWRYPASMRTLSQQIRQADNTDPQAVIAILEAHPALFLNTQSRYLLPAGRKTAPDRISKVLGSYAGLGLGAALAPAFTAMTGAPAPPFERSNAASAPFDTSVFQTPPLRRFLAERNALDARLWHEAKNHPQARMAP